MSPHARAYSVTPLTLLTQIARPTKSIACDAATVLTQHDTNRQTLASRPAGDFRRICVKTRRDTIPHSSC